LTKKCDGVNHKVIVDVVTFISHVDQHFQNYVTGSAADVRKQLKDIAGKKAPSAEIWYDYCCEDCKEATDGSGSGS